MIQSLARGIDILSVIHEKGTVTMVEIADIMGVDKSTVSRLMGTLMAYDMVSVDPATKKYRLGFRILYLSEGVKKNFNIVTAARPYLHKIVSETGESVHLATMGNRKMYIVDQVLSGREYKLSAQIGMIEEWHCSSVGKCVLAYKSESFINELLKDYDYKQYTPKTMTDYEALSVDLRRIRDQGYALDDEEVSVGVRCIAVPIFTSSGVMACIGMSAPKDQITKETIRTYTRCMKKYSRQISEELRAESTPT